LVKILVKKLVKEVIKKIIKKCRRVLNIRKKAIIIRQES
jgi:hypothetical protein